MGLINDNHLADRRVIRSVEVFASTYRYHHLSRTSWLSSTLHHNTINLEGWQTLACT